MINAVLFDLLETLITESAVQPTRASSLGEISDSTAKRFAPSVSATARPTLRTS